MFSATGMNADQAQDFRELVDEALVHIRENGFDKEAVEAVAAATRLELLLTAEEPNVGPNLLPSVAYSWTADGDVNAYQQYVDNTANYVKFAENGAYQDLAPAYDLVYEVLFESKLDDVQKIADRVEKVKTSLKQTITNQPFNIQIYRAFASVNPGFAYYNYANFLDYYAFLEQVQNLLADNPDEALAKLDNVRKMLHNSVGAVSGFAGNADSQNANRETADAFFAKLDKEERARAEYDLPKIAQSEDLIVDSAVQYNMMFAPYDQLGVDGYSGAMDALTSFMSDAFLCAQLRDQYGAYGVQHAATEDGVFLFSFRDPNVTQTFDVYGELSKMLTDSQIEQEALEGYILSAYSGYATSSGELAGALSALVDTIDGRKQERFLTYMEELKGVTVDKVKSYTQMYEELYNKGLKSTSGGAAVINENAKLYEVILNPFAIKEMPQAELNDVAEDDWFAEGIAFSVDNKFIAPLTETTFGPLEPLTVDVYAKALNEFLGVGAPAQESIDVFKQYGMLPPDAEADQTMTREEFANFLIAMLKAVQIDVKEDLQDLPELSDIDQITVGNEDDFRFLLGNDLFPLFAEDMLAPKELATRADFAFVLLALNDF